MEDNDFTVLEMLGCIHQDLDMGQIEERFVESVSEVFSFDRVALFFVKHRKEVLQGKLSRGFDPEVIRAMQVPIRGKSVLIDPLITGLPVRNPLSSGDPYIDRLQLRNFALIPIVNKKSVPCWELKKCRITDCPAYGKKWMRCWLVSGTKCSRGGCLSVEEKARICSACPIFANMDFRAMEGVIIADNSLSGRPITDDSVNLLSIIAHSVGLAINNSKLYMKTFDLSIRDSLTGLYNRRYFDERLMNEMERSRRYDEKMSLILCDVDNFKMINDKYGHPTGDTVLRWVASILTSSVRSTDIVSRYGGDEFAALLLNSDMDHASLVTRKLSAAFRDQTFRHRDARVTITLSFGVSSFIRDSDGFESLIARADDALYNAKSLAKNSAGTGRSCDASGI